MTYTDPRVTRSRALIIPAATRRFLADGYLSAKLDDIAAEAGVSKRTIYNLFGDKEHLFREVLSDVFATADVYAVEVVEAMAAVPSLAARLEAAAVELAQIVSQEPIIRLRRLMIGEAERFPELAAEYWDRAPGRTISALTARFEHFRDLGLLDLDDPRIAAEHFAYLVIGAQLDRGQFTIEAPPTASYFEARARAGVHAFLRAYPVRAPADDEVRPPCAQEPI